VKPIFHYLPPHHKDHHAKAMMGWLLQNAEWEERTSARHEAFWSDTTQPYTYGKGRGTRTYYPKPFPEAMQGPKRFVEAMAGRQMHLCFLNRYDDQHQHLGWHSDDSPEQDDDAPIIVQSYGAAREIWVRPNGGGPETHQRILLASGSTFVMMPGMQQTHQHRIPKHPQPCGMRISLTWRALKENA
jgi:alkylated DNA repair dioxygenase AlkB